MVLLGCTPQTGKSDTSSKITILGTITGKDEEHIQRVLEPFTEETGIKVIYEGTDAFATILPVRVESGNSPNIAMFPQPGLMTDLARNGKLIPLDSFMDIEKLSDAYSPNWLELGSVDGQLYGIWYRVSLKSLVWYSPAAFSEAGYKIPTTWDEMLTLSDQIVADGRVPWCLGIESGDATGWVGTDWVEDIILRTADPEVYDQWVTHKLPFTDPVVKNAFEQFGKIALNPKYVVGGKTGVLSIPFGDSPRPLFDKPPGCYMHRQASFITDFFPENVVMGQDVNVFPLPGIKQEFDTPVLVGGIVLAVLSDTPETRKLMEYLVTAQSQKIWVSKGGYLSPNQQVSLDDYPDDITKRQAEILANGKIVRFDGSDMMPGAVGTGTFWTGIVDYVGGTDLDTVLKNIDASWPEE